MPKLLLIGLGGLGRVILELLAAEPIAISLVAASRDAGRGIARCNLARLGAVARGRSPAIRFVPLDLDNRDATAGLVVREAPDVILTTATRLTWWLPQRLPDPYRSALRRAGFGVWLPAHLSLTLKLMRALADAGYRGLTLTAPFPDVVNCVLGRVGLAPAAGIGNVDELAAKVRLLAAERLGAPMERIEVTLVAHHALLAAGFGDGREEDVPPFFLRVACDGSDVTDTVDARGLLLASCRIPSGAEMHFLSAASAVRLVLAVLEEIPARLHAPGPAGLPGGYPVLASRAGVRVAPIDGLPLADAIAINERSHRFDGIERIEANGTVVFAEQSAGILRETLGYDCKRLTPAEADGRAAELVARLRNLLNAE